MNSKINIPKRIAESKIDRRYKVSLLILIPVVYFIMPIDLDFIGWLLPPSIPLVFADDAMLAAYCLWLIVKIYKAPREG